VVSGRRRSGGFTLVELLAVVIILGIIVALAATRLDFLVPKYRLRAAIREVASVLKIAKARAASTGKEVYVEMDLSSGRYWLLVPFSKTDPAKRSSEFSSVWDGVNTPPPPAAPVSPGALGDVSQGGLALVDAYVYQPIFDRTLPEGVDFWDVILGPRERTDRGVARVRMSPFGVSGHTIVNLRSKEDRQAAVRFNGFTGHVSFYDQHQDAEVLLDDQGP
jgi:prepilin-type N-terminal cleavage/methylation domain-containing protein